MLNSVARKHSITHQLLRIINENNIFVKTVTKVKYIRVKHHVY